VDRTPVQKAFAEHCGLTFKMVSGYPQHEGAKALGVYDEERASTRRVTFIIDKEGILRHVIDDPRDMERHARESLDFLRQLEGEKAHSKEV
jgi:peroxiredoxin Q/BCP